jgi:hypothetical protein
MLLDEWSCLEELLALFASVFPFILLLDIRLAEFCQFAVNQATCQHRFFAQDF